MTTAASEMSAPSDLMRVNVETALPAAPRITSPENNTTVTTRSLVLSGTSEPSTTVNVYKGMVLKGSQESDAAGNWSITLSGLRDGAHDYYAKAEDAAGNLSAPSNILTIIADAYGPNSIRSGFDDNQLNANDDGSTGAVRIGFPVDLFGNTYTSLYVNNNGNVTFGGPLSRYTPQGFASAGAPIIAPFWADVDTRVGELVSYAFGQGTVNGRDAFGVNYVGVGYFSGHNDKLNDFQLVIIDRSDVALGAFDIEFNYERVEWETGDASGGAGGLGGVSARAGYSKGTGAAGTWFELTGSGVNGAFLDSNATTGLIHGSRNSAQPGRYLFRVRSGAVAGEPIIDSNTFKGLSVPWQAYASDPVNTATGNYIYSHTDLSIPTRSLPLAFTRAYNSVSPPDGPLGYGWTHSYNVSIGISSADGSAMVTYGDGHTARFEPDGSTYLPPPGAFSTLIRSSDGFMLTEKDQTKYAFDSDGRLASITDRNSNVTALSYTGGKLTRVTEPGGRALALGYDSSGRITYVTDPLGRTAGYAYSDVGDLVAATDALGKTTTYGYDADHRITSVTDANDHTFVANVYDAEGRVIEQRDAENHLTDFSYDIPNRVTTVRDALGHTTTYAYDSRYRLLFETNGLGQTTSYTWDDSNNRKSVKDARGNTTFSTYDGRGNLLTVTDPLGRATARAYDDRNNLLTETDPLGRVTRNTYDASGNMLSSTNALGGVTSWTYGTDPSVAGLPQTQRDPLGRVTGFTYDRFGNVLTVADPLGKVTRNRYDLAGRKRSSTDPLGHATAWTYDAADRVLTTRDPAGALTTNTYDVVGNLLTTRDPLSRVTARTYTAKDKLATVKDPAGYTTTFSYDAVGNQTGVTDGNGRTTAVVHDEANRVRSTSDGAGRTTAYTYDPNGNRLTVTDPLGNVTATTYDKLNRPIATRDPLGNVTRTSYDAVGNRTMSRDALGRATRYAYDKLNRLRTVTDAGGGVTSYAYDAAGNRISVVDANRHVTRSTYDALHRLTSERDPLGNTTRYGYDAAGSMISKTDGNGTTTSYTYDAASRLSRIAYPSSSVSYTYNAAGARTSMTDPTGKTTYAYDPLNRPTAIAQPGGKVTYSYDAVNRTSVTLPGGLSAHYTYDPANRLAVVTDWGARTTRYTYDGAGRLTAAIRPNRVATAYTYDAASRLTGVRAKGPAGTVLSAEYALDAVGNRTAMTEPTGTTRYTYDSLNRLAGVTYGSGNPGSVAYTYDAVGNRLSMTADGAVTAYTYDRADRLTSTASQGRTTALTWDRAGQLLSHGDTRYAWDAAGRVTGVTGGSTGASYTYNGDGVRVGKTVGGTTTAYLQDLAAGLPQLLQETGNGLPTRYVYGTELIAQVGRGVTYYEVDGLGSVRALTNASGSPTATYGYDAFGVVRSQTGAANTFGYTGEQLDPESGLIHLRARYYDPVLGRFVSPDPFPGFEHASQSLNPYAYVHNNPINATDPSGQIANFLVGAGIGGAVSLGLYAGSTWLDPKENWHWGRAGVAIGTGALTGAAAPLITGGPSRPHSVQLRLRLSSQPKSGSSVESSTISWHRIILMMTSREAAHGDRCFGRGPKVPPSPVLART